MILIITSSIIVIVAVGLGVYVSKSKFNHQVKELSAFNNNTVDADSLYSEIDRIEELKKNLSQAQKNVKKLNIPTPQSISSYDDSKSSLNKLSRFFEQHSLATVGTEQVILSILPTSQVGESIHSLVQLLPPDLATTVFGDAVTSVKEGLVTVLTKEGLHRFAEGATHLSKWAEMSMRQAVSHHDILGICLTPIKAGAKEALGINDAAHSIVNSLQDVGTEMANSAAESIDVGDLTSMSDIDITGHIPVVTIALSSFREIQLLSDDKTDFLTAAKNVALDAVGAGVGAAAGAKAGAAAGFFFGGPIAAAIGGLVSGIGGAVGGRAITNKIKVRALNEAIAEYERQYALMQSETNEQSRNTASNIKAFAEKKRDAFRNSPALTTIPIADTEDSISQIALVLYQFVVNELMEMKSSIRQLRSSIWYSDNKYDAIIHFIEKEITDLEKQLPPVDFIKKSPETAIATLLNLSMPNRSTNKAYQAKIDECSAELKSMNDQDNANLLLWSYMVNNLYQQTLNEIADFSNNEMKSLNKFFGSWRKTLADYEQTVIKEKAKLGRA